MLTSFAVCWYALGWVLVGNFCTDTTHSYGRLTLGWMMAIFLFAPALTVLLAFSAMQDVANITVWRKP